jgi:PAS domain S-box-containing protein
MIDDGAGSTDGLFSASTGQNHAGQALHRERDLISAVLDTTGALVVVLDRQGRIVLFNQACERTTGYSFDEVRGNRLWDLFLIAEEVAPVRAVFDRLRAGQFPSEFENTWLTKAGARRLIAWSNTAILGSDGEIEYVVGTGIDITDRRQAEAQRDATLDALRQAHDELEMRVAERTAELRRASQILEEEVVERRSAEGALRETESHLRSLMEGAESYAIFRLAVDPTYPYGLRIVLASPSLKELLGISDLSNVAGWIGNIHPDDVGRVVQANTRSIETATLFDEQYRVCRPARGEWGWVHNRSTPVFDASGMLTHYNGLMVDITKQKRVEEQIRRQNEFLAALHETTLGIVSQLNPDEVLEAILERALKLVSATYGFLYLVRPGEDELEVRVGTKSYREFVGLRLKRGEGLAGKILESGQPLAVNDYHTWSGRSRQFEAGAFGPSLGAPLMSGTQVVGALGVGRPASASPFGQDELDMISRFSHLASLALDNARLHGSVQQKLVELQQAQQALQQRLASEGVVALISTEFVNLGPAEIDAGIQRALEVIGQVAEVDRTYLFQFAGDGTTMDNTHEWCAEGIQPYMDSLRGLPRAVFPWFLGQLEQLEVVSVPRVAAMPPEAGAERAECEREGIQSIILVPLAYRGTLAGFLGFDSVRRERSWEEATVALLKTVAGIVVNALEHKRAQAIQEGQRQFLELLATGRDFSETLHNLVRLIEDQWPGMLGLILLLDEDGKHLHIGASASLPDDYVQSIEGLEIGPMVGSCGTACYRRERVIVEDTATDPRWEGLRDLALRYGLRACWSEPVFSPDGQVVGTFAMYYRRPRAPTEAELRAIELGAHLVGVAIQHDRAERALEKAYQTLELRVDERTRELSTLLEVSKNLVSRLELEPLLGSILDELRSVVDYEGCTVYGLEGDELVARARRGRIPEDRAMSLRWGIDDPLDRLVLRGREPVLVSDTRGDTPEARAYRESLGGQQENAYSHIRSWLGVPLVVKGHVIGELALDHSCPEFFTPAHARLAMALANQAAVAIENARLYEAEQQRTRELTTLNSIAAVVSGSLDLRQVMSAALDKTCQALSMEFGTAYSLESSPDHGVDILAMAPDEPGVVGQEAVAPVMHAMQEPPGQSRETGRLALLAHRGVSAQYAEFVRGMQLPGEVAVLARLGRPFAWLVKDSVPANSDLAELLDQEECRQVLTLPLIAKGKIVGALNLGTRTPRDFTIEQLSLLAAIGQQIGMAVDNARLYEAGQERTKELATLNSIASVVSRSLDLREIMCSALDETLDVMGLSRGVVYRLEGESADLLAGPILRLMEHRGITPELARLIDPLPLHGTLVEQAAVERQPVVWAVPDYPQVALREHMNRAGMQTGVSVPLLSKDRMVGTIILGAPSQRVFSSEELSLLSAIGQQIGVAVENARLYEAEQSRRAEAERRRLVAEGMREILAILNSRQSLSDTLNLIATHACRVLGSDAAALLRLDRTTGLLGIQAHCKLDPHYAAQISMPLGVGTAGRALAERRPVVIADTLEAAAYMKAGGADRPEIVSDLLHRLTGRFRALFSVPVIVKDEAHGAITFYYSEPHSFSDEEFRLALSVADQTALALENARLREQAEQAAAMAERGRLARELHDSVTQSLYSVTMYAEAAARLMPPGHQAAAEHLRDARDTAQEALREMRLLIYQLRPAAVEQGGLAVALQLRLDAVERRGGIHAELAVEGEDRLPAGMQAELHQVAQEALNNALKHAHAQRVQVRLKFGEAEARLEVEDDGVGFDLAAVQGGGGLGLPGMQERVQKIGGRLEIKSAPGHGTKVEVEVPTGGRA